jgi:hypothetical protein
MPAHVTQPKITADECGIHFVRNPGRDIVVLYDEIEAICALGIAAQPARSFWRCTLTTFRAWIFGSTTSSLGTLR